MNSIYSGIKGKDFVCGFSFIGGAIENLLKMEFFAYFEIQ